MKDLLEQNVDEKYYLSDKQISDISNWKAHQKPFEKVLGNNSISPTLTARGAGEMHSGMVTYCEELENTTNLQEKLLINEKTKKGYAEATEGDGVYINRPHQKRGVVQKDMIQTLKCNNNDIGVVVKDKNMKEQLCNELIEKGVVKDGDVINHSYTNGLCGKNPNSRVKLDDYIETSDGISPTLTTRPDCLGVSVCVPPLRIRKLTPKECWRLMGFDDKDIDKLKQFSNAQLYKMAGNSIVVNVLVNLFTNLLKKEEEDVEVKNKVITYTTDKMIDLSKLQEKEPELFEELAEDYPCENATYVFEVKKNNN